MNFLELVEGNPGAISALSEVGKLCPELLPEFARSLSNQEITGPMIWVCFSDLCKRNVSLFISGILSGKLKERLIETQGWKYHQRNKVKLNDA